MISRRSVRSLTVTAAVLATALLSTPLEAATLSATDIVGRFSAGYGQTHSAAPPAAAAAAAALANTPIARWGAGTTTGTARGNAGLLPGSLCLFGGTNCRSGALGGLTGSGPSGFVLRIVRPGSSVLAFSDLTNRDQPTPTPIPLPAASLLLLSALGGLALMRRRRGAAAAAA